MIANLKSLAGILSNEGRYFSTKFKYECIVQVADKSQNAINYVNKILLERQLLFSAKPQDTSQFHIDNIVLIYVFYEDRSEHDLNIYLFDQIIKYQIKDMRICSVYFYVKHKIKLRNCNK